MTIQLPSVSRGLQSEKNHLPKNHLQTLLDGFCDFSGVEKSGLLFKGLSLNSKKVHEEFLFLACAGSSPVNQTKGKKEANKTVQHGIAYAGDAINRGATCIAWEPTESLEDMPVSCMVENKPDVPLIRVELLHEKVGEISARFYGHPSRSVNMIGITGTNGKTSTTHFIAQLMHAIDGNENSDCAVIGTLGNGLYGQLEKSTHTTPDAVTLQALIAEFRDKQVSHIVMEVSSHALSQGRVNSVEFDTAVFTNLTRDHLDYHGNMESYAQEKLKLFQCPTLKNIIVNKDDLFSKEIIEMLTLAQSQQNNSEVGIADIISCSRLDSSANYYARDIVLDRKGISFTLCVNASDKQQSSDEKNYQVNSHLVGDFNIDNLLAAIAVLHQHNYQIEEIITAVKEITTVSGRMELINVKDMTDESDLHEIPLIVVDYAHTPDALEKGLIALRAHAHGNLVCVFGCGGDRDKGKRSLMAEVAEKYADQIMVTSDNPRTESPEQIIADIMDGFNNREKVFTEIDRKKAINKILQTVNKEDVVLIAGKGHEDYQEINGERLPFSDSDCVLSFYSSEYKH